MLTDLKETDLKDLIEGKHATFNALYLLYKPHALRFAIHMLHNEEAAEDIVHDLFAKIWDGRANIKSNLNFRSFLFTCLRNIIIDHLKHEKRYQYILDNYTFEFLSDDEPADEKEYRQYSVRKALRSLTSKRKQIVCQCLVDGKSYQEVADVYGISKNTVKNQLVKAKKMIKDQLTSPADQQKRLSM